MKKIAGAFLLMFCVSAYSQSTDPFEPQPCKPVDKPTEPTYPPEPPKPVYDSYCAYDLSVTASRNFDKKWEAEEWCEAFDDCKVVKKGSNYGRWFEASYSKDWKLEYTGTSYSLARLNIFRKVANLIEDQELYGKVYSHSGKFTSCWAEKY